MSPAPAAAPAVLHPVWPAVAAQVVAWAQAERLPLAQVWWLVPQPQLAVQARLAMAQRGGWQPQVDAAAALAGQLAPWSPAPGGCSGDARLDRLRAQAMLGDAAWARQWQQRDAAGWRRALDLFVQTAHALRAGAQARPPAARTAWWETARAGLRGGGPGQLERMLAQAALEWVMQADAPGAGGLPLDALFALRPAGWVVTHTGLPDSLAPQLAAHARALGLPLLELHVEGTAAAVPAPRLVRTQDAEAQAQAAAAQVRAEWQASADADGAARAGAAQDADAATAPAASSAPIAPIALIAHDRMAVRRISALLARSGVALHDETGWALATTRAGAAVLLALQAAQAQRSAAQRPDAAASDRWLDWLKADPTVVPATASGIEQLWRGVRQDAAARVQAAADWAAAQQRLAPLAEAGAARNSLPLTQWLAQLATLWAPPGSPWWDDAAGQAVAAALRLPPHGAAWPGDVAQQRLTLDAFADWVQSALDGAVFIPPPQAQGSAGAPGAPQVVVTPLAQAALRPWRAVVMPGCDDTRLGPVQVEPTLLPHALATALGLPGGEQRRAREQAALAHLLAGPRVSLLWQANERDQPLAPSSELAPWLPPEPLPLWAEPLALRAATPVWPPQPHAGALPAKVSASALRALRECPYSFYVRYLLGLRQAEELGEAASKRDWGVWLHAVLHRYHAGDTPSGSPFDWPAEAARLQACADAEDAALTAAPGSALLPAELMLFRASFDALVPRYLLWWQAERAAGWQWLDGERTLAATVPYGLPRLEGRVDRLDFHAASHTIRVLDYKAQNKDSVKKTLREPLEDTQLLFYTAQLQHTPFTPSHPELPASVHLQAGYLALDDAEKVEIHTHENAAQHAEQWLLELGGEWERIAGGAALPALGDDSACTHYASCGLSRRGHWAAGADPLGGDPQGDCGPQADDNPPAGALRQ